MALRVGALLAVVGLAAAAPHPAPASLEPLSEPTNEVRAYSVISATYYHEDTDAVVDPEMCHIQEGSQWQSQRHFCDEGKCWPMMWLLGAQKSATSAIYDVLTQCGIALGAWPGQDMTGSVLPSFCGDPCKETHFFTNPFDPPLASELDGELVNGTNAVDFASTSSETTSLRSGKFLISDQVTFFRRGIMPQAHVDSFTSLYRVGDHPGGCGARTNKHTTFTDRAQSSCDMARFIEATPSTDYPLMPKLLASAMPGWLLKQARFVMILREPVERMLSWYNYNRSPNEKWRGAPWDPCASTERSSTFDEFVSCRDMTEGFLNKGDAGNYGQFMQNLMSTPVERKQVLVFNYKNAFVNGSAVAQTVKAVTMHYGGPVLDRVYNVPPSNSENHPGKVKEISCGARDRLQHIYAPMLALLYHELHESEKARHGAPSYEPFFEPFQLDVKCGEREKTLGELMSAYTKAELAATLNVVGSAPHKQKVVSGLADY